MKIFKVIALALCLLLALEQSGLAQIAGQIDISGHIAGLRDAFVQDKFRPLHLRYLLYDNLNNKFKLLLDKGDWQKGLSPQGTVPEKQDLEGVTKTLLNYFFVGITLPNDSFWVNLRPDSPDNIIDPALGTTDVGKILLEADLQLKKDTAKFASPQTPEGKKYWDKLYKKAEEILGYENSTIPTLTRPWIVPGEIIIRETESNAYIYKATLKVMLEEDYLKDSATYNFKDERLKQLNEYSSQLLRELIIPKLTKEVNTAKRYAPLRQVYYSLILAQWFKQKFYGRGGLYSWLIDKKELSGLTSKTRWSKVTYFKEYQKSFKDGEYNIQEPIYTLSGKTIRSYFSGGIAFGGTGGQGILEAIRKGLILGKRNILELPKNLKYIARLFICGGNIDRPFETEVAAEEVASAKPVKFTNRNQELQYLVDTTFNTSVTKNAFNSLRISLDDKIQLLKATKKIKELLGQNLFSNDISNSFDEHSFVNALYIMIAEESVREVKGLLNELLTDLITAQEQNTIETLTDGWNKRYSSGPLVDQLLRAIYKQKGDVKPSGVSPERSKENEIKLRIYRLITGGNKVEGPLAILMAERMGSFGKLDEQEAEYVKSVILDALLALPSNRYASTALGYGLLNLVNRYPNLSQLRVELAPIIIMNMWREPGGSGEWPFLSNYLKQINEFIAYLTDSEISQLRNKNIPGLMQIIETMRNNPDNFKYRTIQNPAAQKNFENFLEKFRNKYGIRKFEDRVYDNTDRLLRDYRTWGYNKDAVEEICKDIGVEPTFVKDYYNYKYYIPNPAYSAIMQGLAEMGTSFAKDKKIQLFILDLFSFSGIVITEEQFKSISGICLSLDSSTRDKFTDVWENLLRHNSYTDMLNILKDAFFSNTNKFLDDREKKLYLIDLLKLTFNSIMALKDTARIEGLEEEIRRILVDVIKIPDQQVASAALQLMSEMTDNTALKLAYEQMNWNFKGLEYVLLDASTFDVIDEIAMREFIPTVYLVNFVKESPDRIKALARLQEIKDNIARGGFELDVLDVSARRLYEDIEYTHFVQLARGQGFNPSRSSLDAYRQILDRGVGFSLGIGEDNRDAAELDYAAVEAGLTLDYIDKIKVRANQLGRPVVVVANLSYGGFVLGFIENELKDRGIKIIKTKIGSSESHDNPWVFKGDLFNGDDLAYIVHNQPIIVVLDGTAHIVDRDGDSGKLARNPDAYQGYRNWVLGFNLAIKDNAGDKTNQGIELLGKNADFVNGFREDFNSFVKGVKELVPTGTNVDYYHFGLWNPANLDLIIRENRQKESVVKVFDPIQLQGPTVIFVNAVMPDAYTPVYIKQKHGNLTHTPAYYDDTGVISRTFFEKTDFGIRLKGWQPVAEKVFANIKETLSAHSFSSALAAQAPHVKNLEEVVPPGMGGTGFLWNIFNNIIERLNQAQPLILTPVEREVLLWGLNPDRPEYPQILEILGRLDESEINQLKTMAKNWAHPEHDMTTTLESALKKISSPEANRQEGIGIAQGYNVNNQRVIEIFNRVKKELNDNEGILPLKLLWYYADNLKNNKMDAVQIYWDIFKAMRLQKRIISHRVEPTPEQQAIIEKVESILQDYLRPLGLKFSPLKVTFLPREIVPSSIGGAHLSYYDTVVFPSHFTGDLLKKALIHECFHTNGIGFPAKKLDEGMTEYLAVKLLMRQLGNEDFSYQSVMKFYRDYIMEPYIQMNNGLVPIYVFELAAILHLIYAIGEKPFLEAYFKGDQSYFESVLGKTRWQEIVELAYQFEDRTGSEVEEYLKGVVKILNSKTKQLSTEKVDKLDIQHNIDKKGGIDFRALPIITQPMQPALGTVPLGTGVRPLAGTVPVVNLDKEWQQIQNMLNAGVIPSSQRIKEYLQACCQKEDFDQEIDKVLQCLADILRLEEERVSQTEPEIREFLVLLESDKSASELQLSLSKITVSPGEPKRVGP